MTPDEMIAVATSFCDALEDCVTSGATEEHDAFATHIATSRSHDCHRRPLWAPDAMKITVEYPPYRFRRICIPTSCDIRFGHVDARGTRPRSRRLALCR